MERRPAVQTETNICNFPQFLRARERPSSVVLTLSASRGFGHDTSEACDHEGMAGTRQSTSSVPHCLDCGRKAFVFQWLLTELDGSRLQWTGGLNSLPRGPLPRTLQVSLHMAAVLPRKELPRGRAKRTLHCPVWTGREVTHHCRLLLFVGKDSSGPTNIPRRGLKLQILKGGLSKNL
uniref:Uncharacterized protein n=1 Tax=Molossus molossus TaxID=27622 RepID=A0A7J8DBS6_MOLMO|nr:hypothetical protein HJG59_009326 [Molossus molossus]